MQDSATVERTLSADSDIWYDENSRGLALAAEGDWSNATDAFQAAAEVVSARTDVAAHEAQALILSNLAQACFRSGRTDDAIRHSQRACALRVALVGEDAITVARARAELAVMLGSMNRAVEGLSLIRRAIAGIERSAGDDDVRLTSVLENAARLAMVAGQPSIAEPFLLRLHALLDAHALSTEPADALLVRLTAFRMEQQVAAMESIALRQSTVDEFTVGGSTATELVVEELPVEELPVEELPVEAVAGVDMPVSLGSLEAASGRGLSVTPAPALELISFDAHEDQPLRDAVMLTDVLLRSTPTSSRAIPPTIEIAVDDDAIDNLVVPPEAGLNLEIIDDEDPPHVEGRAVSNLEFDPDAGETVDLEIDVAIDDAIEETLDVEINDEVEIEDNVEVQDDDEVHANAPTSADDMFSGSPFDLIDEQAMPSISVSPPSSFGMDVELDLVMDESNSRDEELPAVVESEAKESAGNLGGLGFAVEYGAVSAALELDDVDQTTPQEPAARTSTPRDSLVVMPTPKNAAPSISARTGDEVGNAAPAETAPRLALHATGDLPSGRTVRKPVIRSGSEPSTGASRVKMIAGAVVTAIAAGAVWFLTMGR